MKKGDWVLATKKSIFPESFGFFLEQHPLGIAKIDRINASGYIVQKRALQSFIFKKEDLVLLKEHNK